VAGLLLALIDLPDFGTPLRRIAGSVEKIAGLPPGEGPIETNTRVVAPDHLVETDTRADAPDHKGS
jgi:hypothetical protein